MKAGKPETRERKDRHRRQDHLRARQPLLHAGSLTPPRRQRAKSRCVSEETDACGQCAQGAGDDRRVTSKATRALVDRVLKEAGGRQNILVINDEAHHAYRIFRQDQVRGCTARQDEDDENAEEEAASPHFSYWRVA